MATRRGDDMTAIDAEYSYPLSTVQEGMLFHTLDAPRSGVYVQQQVGALHEELNCPAFRRAWQWIVDRHPVLRTGVSFADSGKLLQRVHTDPRLAVEEHGWRGTEVGEREERLHRYLVADRRRGFELGAQTPLMRLALFRMDQADYRFVWTYHHALLDGRSHLRVLTELFSAYEAFCRGEEAPRCERARPYRDYIEWLGMHDTDAEAERFWRGALRGFSAPTPLVVDTASSRSDSPDDDGFATRGVRLSKRSTAALKRLAGQHGLTLTTLVQGAWALLLSRYSGEDDIVFGATRACRTPEARPDDVWVGLFINTLPVRVGLSSEEPLIPWLQQLRAQWVAAREYEHTPLVDIRAWSEVPPGTPLFESVVMFEHQSLRAAVREQGKHWSGREFRLIQATNYPITISAFGETQLLLQIGFDAGRFEAVTIERMIGHLGSLLEGIAAHPQARLGELELLTEAERHQLLFEWNDTPTEYPRDRCIHELFEEQAEHTPEAVAVVSGDDQLTYRELNGRTNQLARHLRALGVGPEVLVGICVERSMEMMVGLLGVLKAGGAYVPLDPAYPKQRLAFMLEDTQAPVLLTQERLVKGLPEHGAEMVCLDAHWPLLAREAEDNPAGAAKADSLAYVIYTSGSTGQPKGVMVEHRALGGFIVAATASREITASDRVLQFCALSFDNSIVEIFPPLTRGGTLVLRSDRMVESMRRFVRECREHAISVLSLTTPFWHELVAAFDREGLALPPSVRLMIFGGEKAQAHRVAQWHAYMAQSARPTRLINAYGQTEATVVATQCELRPEGGWYRTTQREVPIGRPLGNAFIYILDGSLNPVPIGVPGELHVGGPVLARGYLNRPELTGERFIPDPFTEEPSARLYRTGDLARYLADGNIEFLGRVDDQVKIRGFRVEPGEVEAVLSGYPAVRQAVVVAKKDANGGERLVAYVVVSRKHAPSVAELRGYLKEKLPEYMVPSAFVTLDTLPLTPNGKVDRRALPAPGGMRPELEDALVVPRDALEEQLAGIWAEVLGLERVGVHDDFFELGGHSLLVTQVVSRVRDAFGVELPLRSLFEEPTIAGLAEKIEAAQEADLALPIAMPSSDSDNLEEERL